MITTLKELIDALDHNLKLPENHHVVAVFENNDSDEVKGFIVAERGNECEGMKKKEYQVLLLEELLEKYS